MLDGQLVCPARDDGEGWVSSRIWHSQRKRRAAELSNTHSYSRKLRVRSARTTETAMSSAEGHGSDRFGMSIAAAVAGWWRGIHHVQDMAPNCRSWWPVHSITQSYIESPSFAPDTCFVIGIQTPKIQSEGLRRVPNTTLTAFRIAPRGVPRLFRPFGMMELTSPHPTPFSHPRI